MKLSISILLLALSAGCGIVPMERSQTQSMQTAENIAAQQTAVIQSVMESSAPPAFEIQMGTNIVRIPVQHRSSVSVNSSGSQSASFTDDLFQKLTTKIPVSIALAIGAVALWLLLMLYRSVKNSSAAFRAFSQAADEGMARAIRSVRDYATTSTDAEEVSKYNALLATLESERGRMKP